MKATNNQSKGFTLMELLVVVGIIGLIVAVALVTYITAKQKSRMTKTQAALSQIQKAVEQLVTDTGKWPNGCTVYGTGFGDIQLTNADAGLSARPAAGATQSGCSWTTKESDFWNGPYLDSINLNDPWGVSYYIDPNYTADSVTFPALVSWGDDKTVGTPNSDDIYIRLR